MIKFFNRKRRKLEKTEIIISNKQKSNKDIIKTVNSENKEVKKEPRKNKES